MRIELIHPMIVHFPIALLSVGVILRIAALWSKRLKLTFLLPASWTILALGVLSAWAAVIAGEAARNIVESSIKDIDILDEHETHALITASVFTIGLFLDGVRAFLMKKNHKRWIVKRGLAVVVWFLYLFGLTNLIITGYYGANLVYEQGAAVSRE